ncbi:MAG: hypothetical protein D6812_14535 [Deltaproteobacteria bacterium]|nr:MAG: hypothetical protein D6812_14535 [Deltaproteobacteria bacterium]
MFETKRYRFLAFFLALLPLLAAPGCFDPNFTGRYSGEAFMADGESVAVTMEIKHLGDLFFATVDFEDTGMEQGSGTADRFSFSVTTKSNDTLDTWTQTSWNGRGVDSQGLGGIDTLTGIFIQKTFTTDRNGEPQMIDFRNGNFVLTTGPGGG